MSLEFKLLTEVSRGCRLNPILKAKPAFSVVVRWWEPINLHKERNFLEVLNELQWRPPGARRWMKSIGSGLVLLRLPAWNQPHRQSCCYCTCVSKSVSDAAWSSVRMFCSGSSENFLLQRFCVVCHRSPKSAPTATFPLKPQRKPTVTIVDSFISLLSCISVH